MFFSVIVPVYNSSSFLDRGIDLLMSQSFKDFEVILVNDGSTDESGSKCDDYSSQYCNVLTFHQENKGTGEARNKGIENATGDYIVFFDTDDSVSPDWLSIIYKNIIEYKPELLVYSYREINKTYQTSCELKFDFNFYSSNLQIKENFVENLSGLNFNNGYVWNKVYERRFLDKYKIRFDNLKIQQDEVFNLKVYPKINKILILPDVLYEYNVYYNHNNTAKYVPDRLDICKIVNKEFLKFCNIWNLQDERFKIYINNRFYNSIVHEVKVNIYHKDNLISTRKRKEKIKSIFADKEVKICLKKVNKEKRKGFNFLTYKAIKNENYFSFILLRKIELKIRNIKLLLKNKAFIV